MKIETITYQLDWSKFHKGYSFFVPCIDHEAARAEVNRVTNRLGIKILTRVTIEEGVKGLRVWRV
jgi:hypothetical protein